MIIFLSIYISICIILQLVMLHEMLNEDEESLDLFNLPSIWLVTLHFLSLFYMMAVIPAGILSEGLKHLGLDIEHEVLSVFEGAGLVLFILWIFGHMPLDFAMVGLTVFIMITLTNILEINKAHG